MRILASQASNNDPSATSFWPIKDLLLKTIDFSGCFPEGIVHSTASAGVIPSSPDAFQIVICHRYCSPIARSKESASSDDPRLTPALRRGSG